MEQVTLETAPHDIPDFGDSPPPKPDDDLWLEYGRKMVQDGPAAIRSAATSLMTGLGALQGIYLGILGFAKFIPENIDTVLKLIFVLPLFAWTGALYLCLKVLMTSVSELNLNSPSELRDDYTKMITEKQYLLNLAFVFMVSGIAGAVFLLIFRTKLM